VLDTETHNASYTPGRGAWVIRSTSAGAPFNGLNFRRVEPSVVNASVTFSFVLSPSSSGRYDLLATWVEGVDVQRASNVRMTAWYAGVAVDETSVDQRVASRGDAVVGGVSFEKVLEVDVIVGSEGGVLLMTISNVNANGRVVVDAVALRGHSQ